VKYVISGVIQLVILVVLAAGVAAGAAALAVWLGGTGVHRAFSLAFYVAGGVLLVLAFLGHGAERKATAPGSEIVLERVFSIPPGEQATLNPTGALGIVALVMLALAVLFDLIFR
jgi:hypothetical protein